MLASMDLHWHTSPAATGPHPARGRQQMAQHGVATTSKHLAGTTLAPTHGMGQCCTCCALPCMVAHYAVRLQAQGPSYMHGARGALCGRPVCALAQRVTAQAAFARRRLAANFVLWRMPACHAEPCVHATGHITSLRDAQPSTLAPCP